MAQGQDDRDTAPGDAGQTRFDPFSLATLADISQQDSACTETEKLARNREWFAEGKLRGSHVLTRTQALKPDDLLDWSGYGSDAVDVDVLVLADSFARDRPAVTPLDAPPKHVLDVGCGIYGSWILAAAKWPGWHRTRFVGLDVAPVLVPPSMVASDSASRISFIQHNLLRPLPFVDERFDYIRCGQLAAGIPEPGWDPFIEELRRCLTSGGTLEIVETSSRPVPPPRLQTALESILSHRLLNLDLRSLMPATLAMNNMGNIRALRLSPPGAPLARPSPDPNIAEPAASRLTTDRDRLLTAAWARCTSAHARPLADAVSCAETSVTDRDAGQVGAAAGTAASSRLAASLPPLGVSENVETELDMWTAELINGASISSLMRQQWGWTCKVDEISRSVLAGQLRDTDMVVRETSPAILAYEERFGRGTRGGRGEAAHMRAARTELEQAKSHRREVAALLNAVEVRLSAEASRAAVVEGELFVLEAWSARK